MAGDGDKTLETMQILRAIEKMGDEAEKNEAAGPTPPSPPTPLDETLPIAIEMLELEEREVLRRLQQDEGDGGED